MAEKNRQSGTGNGKSETATRSSTDDAIADFKRHSIHLKPGEKEGEKKRATSVSDDESGVIARAVEVIGNKNEAMRWMGTPVRALEYSTPISLLGTRKGRQAVIATLGRLEHGVL
jgi:putative toxin-antitoxin system antitoxin component (TIGR02293 family)